MCEAEKEGQLSLTKREFDNRVCCRAVGTSEEIYDFQISGTKVLSTVR